jgi:RNA polymerase sigma-70 factor, ECF subfamily
MTTTDDDFQAHRSALLGLAYRLLGSMWDAEDVVQDAYVRWSSSGREDVRDPRAYLMTTVTHLCMDLRTSARARSETYPGPWLPEPVASERLGPLDSAELRDTVAYATMHMMERLNPAERAVFVLRQAFQYSYDDIAPVVGASAASCRQLYRRAANKLEDGRDRFAPERTEHAGFLTAFVSAARAGDLDALTELLSRDVVAWNDGGGRVRAALRPILGRDQVIAFVLGLMRRYPMASGRFIEANGETAMRIAVDGSDQYVAVDVRDGRITEIYAVLNPDKLTRLDATIQPFVA